MVEGRCSSGWEDPLSGVEVVIRSWERMEKNAVDLLEEDAGNRCSDDMLLPGQCGQWCVRKHVTMSGLNLPSNVIQVGSAHDVEASICGSSHVLADPVVA